MKYEQIIIINEGLDSHPQNLHTLSSFGQKIYGQKVLNI